MIKMISAKTIFNLICLLLIHAITILALMDGGDYARLNTEPTALPPSQGICPAISWTQILRPTPISTTSSTPYPIEEVAVTPLLAPDPPTTTTPTTPQAATATTTKTFTTPTTALEPPNTAPSTPDPIKRENEDEKGKEVDTIEGEEAVPHPATTGDTTAADDIIFEPSEKSVPYIVK